MSAVTMALTLDVAAVARLLSMTPADFRRRRPTLTVRHGFPRALPGCGRVWSRAQVVAWIEAGGIYSVACAAPQPRCLGGLDPPRRLAPAALPPAPAQAQAQAGEVVILMEARRRLEARYGRGIA